MKTRIYEDLADMFPLWRETTLEKKDHDKTEADFIVNVLSKSKKPIKTIIDLGGGVGTHSKFLSKLGYKVTLFDQSKKALRIAKKSIPGIKIRQGSFENINIKEKFDAAICMWSTLSYVLNKKGQKHFYKWQSEHIKHLIILDEANFYRYANTFHKIYGGENKEYKLRVIRDWALSKNLKKTKFIYEITNKRTGTIKIVKDSENEQYLTIEEIQDYLGKGWNLQNLLGGYSLRHKFNKKKSKRIIPIFDRNN